MGRRREKMGGTERMQERPAGQETDEMDMEHRDTAVCQFY